MLKKDITYDTVDGESITETFYFNLTKAELIEMELSYTGGFTDTMEKIVADENGPVIIAEMKKIILKSCGQRSPDGKRFIKNQDVRDEFESSEAYSVLFMELVTEADAAVAFIQGIMPKDMVEETKEKLEFLPATPQGIADVVNEQQPVDAPNLTPEPRFLSEAELRAMDRDELKSGLATGKYRL